jgi:hypothetical protein
MSRGYSRQALLNKGTEPGALLDVLHVTGIEVIERVKDRDTHTRQ